MCADAQKVDRAKLSQTEVGVGLQIKKMISYASLAACTLFCMLVSLAPSIRNPNFLLPRKSARWAVDLTRSLRRGAAPILTCSSRKNARDEFTAFDPLGKLELNGAHPLHCHSFPPG